MKLNQELCSEAEEVKISDLGVEGQIILLRQSGFPVLRQVREDHHVVLTWEESCTTEYVPQFTTSLGRSHIWRSIIAPI